MTAVPNPSSVSVSSAHAAPRAAAGAVDQRRGNAKRGAIPQQKTVTIGVVLKTLKPEFPDVTVSKIRYLESEGLITPQRMSSGYRRYTDADIDRLRYILVTQRDNYLPLKVIRQQLEAMDQGLVTPMTTKGTTPLISPDKLGAPVATRLSDADVAAHAQVSEQFVSKMLSIGLIRPNAAGYFTEDDVRIVAIAAGLKEFGFDERHIRTLKTAAARQAGMIAQVAGPVAKSPAAGAKPRAEEISKEMTALVASLHASLVNSLLREQL